MYNIKKRPFEVEKNEREGMFLFFLGTRSLTSVSHVAADWAGKAKKEAAFFLFFFSDEFSQEKESTFIKK